MKLETLNLACTLDRSITELKDYISLIENGKSAVFSKKESFSNSTEIRDVIRIAIKKANDFVLSNLKSELTILEGYFFGLCDETYPFIKDSYFSKMNQRISSVIEDSIEDDPPVKKIKRKRPLVLEGTTAPKKMRCPHGYIFGEDYATTDDCFACSVGNQCESHS